MQTNETIKKAFVDGRYQFENGVYENYYVNFEDIADWWLQKLADREKELVEEIKKLEKVYTASTLVFKMIDTAAVDGYNYNIALEDVLAIIEKK